MSRVPLGVNDGGWCPSCRGETYFMSRWRGEVGLYRSECKQCGERRVFVDTDLIGAINALIEDGGIVVRRSSWDEGWALKSVKQTKNKTRNGTRDNGFEG